MIYKARGTAAKGRLAGLGTLASWVPNGAADGTLYSLQSCGCSRIDERSSGSGFAAVAGTLYNNEVHMVSFAAAAATAAAAAVLLYGFSRGFTLEG